MCENFDDLKMVEILVSIRSDDDNSPEEPIKSKEDCLNKLQRQNSPDDENVVYEIKQTLNLDHTSPHPQQKPSSKISDHIQNSHLSSNWNDSSSFNSSSIRNSFWDDSSDFQVQTQISHLKSTEPESKEEKKEEVKKEVEVEDENMILIGKSMYTSKPTSMIRAPKPAEKQPKVEADNETYGINESVYLTSEPMMKKKVKGIQFKQMDNHLFWKHKDRTVEISYNIIKSLTEAFLKSETLIPLIEEQQYQSELSPFLLSRFTDLLNDLEEASFTSIFHSLKQSKSVSIQEEISYKKYLTGLLSINHYSKVELLKNHLNEKIQCLELVKSSFEEIGAFNEEIEKCKKNVGDLELLICFEKAEKYCEAKESNSIEQQIWKERHQKVKEMRKRWIQKERLLIQV